MKAILVASLLPFLTIASVLGDEIDDLVDDLVSGGSPRMEMSKWMSLQKASDTKFEKDFQTIAADWYLAQVKWSIVDQERHGGWPFRSFLVMDKGNRILVMKELKQRYAAGKSPLLAYALIAPAIYEADQALEKEVVAKADESPKLRSILNQQLESIWYPFILQYRSE